MPPQKAESGKTRIGWIGTGVMGRWMCQHVITKGYKAAVYNRSKDKAQAAARCRRRTGPTRRRQVAENPMSSSPSSAFPKDVRDVFLGRKAPWPAAKPGTILVDMTTSDPTLAQEIYAAAKAKGVDSLDAPVSGGDVGAKNAALSIMVGGDTEVVEAVKPVLECMGKTIIHQGPAGAGQHTKMVNQILIASTWSASAKRCCTRYKAGLDPKTVLQSVGGGAAASWSLNNLGPRIIDRNFEPGFFVEHFIKDMGIALDESKTHGPGHARAGAGESALYRGAGPGLWPQGDAGVDAGAGADIGDQASVMPLLVNMLTMMPTMRSTSLMWYSVRSTCAMSSIVQEGPVAAGGNDAVKGGWRVGALFDCKMGGDHLREALADAGIDVFFFHLDNGDDGRSDHQLMRRTAHQQIDHASQSLRGYPRQIQFPKKGIRQ